MTFFAANRCLSRRSFLRGAGVALSLPMLDAMIPAFGRSAWAAAADQSPRRMVAIQTTLGVLPHYFWPEAPGADASAGTVQEKGKIPNYPQGAIKDYQASPYLEVLKDFRSDMTVFCGVSHPGVDGGHANDKSFFTGAPHPTSSTFKNSVSLDQLAAERIGSRTRIPVLITRMNGSEGIMSVTRAGVRIPEQRSVSALYRQMFVQGTAAQINARLTDLKKGKSLLDFVTDSAKSLQKDLGPKDRERLDQYFSSVRDLEVQLHATQEWEKKPKPKVNVPEPEDGKDFVTRSKKMYDIIRLALETDSTRLVTVIIDSNGLHSEITGVTSGTHPLTHHGNRPDALAELRKIETAQFEALAGFLASLKGSKEKGETLLDRSMVLYGTCMGSANGHTNHNLPMLLAGGGFKHQGLLAFDTTKNYPLANLYVSMLQRLGLEIDRFSSSTGTMRGLELA
jgi:hypothetical protein